MRFIALFKTLKVSILSMLRMCYLEIVEKTLDSKHNKLLEVTSLEIKEVEAKLREIESANKKIDDEKFKKHIQGAAAQWFLILELFKDAEALYFSLTTELQNQVRPLHRILLIHLLARVEVIDLARKTSKTDIKEATGYRNEDLDASLEFIRRKYRQWYGPIDAKAAGETWEKLSHECSSPA